MTEVELLEEFRERQHETLAEFRNAVATITLKMELNIVELDERIKSLKA